MFSIEDTGKVFIIVLVLILGNKRRIVADGEAFIVSSHVDGAHVEPVGIFFFVHIITVAVGVVAFNIVVVNVCIIFVVTCASVVI